jgi:SHS2 domain-containing protein
MGSDAVISFIQLVYAMYEVFEHTADLGLRIRAATQEDLFRDAARALYSVVIANLDDVATVQSRDVRIDGSDPELLLFDWLSELLYLFDVDHLVLVDYLLKFDAGGLSATCRGERFDASRHRSEHEVKAITYHGLKVARTDQGWLAEVIVDI